MSQFDDCISSRLGDEGIQTLLRSLVKNTTLTYLNIGSNDFTELSAMALSEMLTSNKTLKTIDITCNKLGEVHVCTCTTCEYFNVFQCSFFIFILDWWQVITGRSRREQYCYNVGSEVD